MNNDGNAGGQLRVERTKLDQWVFPFISCLGCKTWNAQSHHIYPLLAAALCPPGWLKAEILKCRNGKDWNFHIQPNGPLDHRYPNGVVLTYPSLSIAIHHSKPFWCIQQPPGSAKTPPSVAKASSRATNKFSTASSNSLVQDPSQTQSYLATTQTLLRIPKAMRQHKVLRDNVVTWHWTRLEPMLRAIKQTCSYPLSIKPAWAVSRHPFTCPLR